MAISPLAGKKAPASLLMNTEALLKAYDTTVPDVNNPTQLVSFGTSGHRGTSLDGTFTAAHILAITQALCDYRVRAGGAGITGPLFIGKDTHALSGPAEKSALEVLAANGVEVRIAGGMGFTPTPTISHAILTYNRGRKEALADGVVITPSHNPPTDGGFKYNPTNGGPADTDITSVVQDAANAYLKAGLKGVKRVPIEQAMKAATTKEHDYVTPYVNDLGNVIDLDAIRAAKLNIGVDPLGGASLEYWQAIEATHKLGLKLVSNAVDPTFSFMCVDHDGKIRMDCSSPYAMAGLVALKDQYAVAFGNDPDSDRHGIVTPSVGLMNPNHFLAVAIHYLLQQRPQWSKSGGGAGIGKTLVSSSMIDRVVASLGRKLVEVPVGFKWFAPGLFDGTIVFGGEESAGASFLRRDGSVWSTDKDGIILCLLAAEITAKTGRDPGEHYRELARKFGTPFYARVDAPASPAQKAAFKKLTPEAVKATTLAGDAITAKLTKAAGNGASIGGLKVETASGWFAARPSGTENIYKIYAESFKSQEHLNAIIAEAQQVVTAALG